MPRLDPTKKHYQPFAEVYGKSVIGHLKLPMKILGLTWIIVIFSATQESERLSTVNSV